MKKFLLRTAAVLLIGGILQSPARADVQYTIPQTVTAILATNLACTGSAQLFTTGTTPGFLNLGQTQHYASIILGGGVKTPNQTVISGIDKSGNIFQISDVLMVGGVGSVVQASGYFAQIQISVTCPTTTSFTLSYTGTSATTNVNSAGYQIGQIDKAIFQAAASGTAQSNNGVLPPFANAFGVALFNYITTPATGMTVTISCGGAQVSSVTITAATLTPNNNTSGQIFQIPPITCPNMSISTSATGTTTFNMEYIFYPPSAPAVSDPCESPAVVKKSVAVNIGTATTTTVVTPNTNQAIFACGWSFTEAGTTPTFQFEYGTGTNCGTGTVVLTGVYALLASQPFASNGASTQFSGIVGNNICIVTGGTTPSLQGVISYVSQ